MVACTEIVFGPVGVTELLEAYKNSGEPVGDVDDEVELDDVRGGVDSLDSDEVDGVGADALTTSESGRGV